MLPTQKMPTAGKLVSAIGLAGLAWFASGVVIAIWPYDFDFGYFRLFSAAVGLVMGWRVIGTRLTRGYLQGMGAGLTGLFALLFWVFLLLSFYEMIQRSLVNRFDGPFEALVGVFDIAWQYAQNVIYMPLIVTLIVGAMLVGLIAEFVARRLP